MKNLFTKAHEMTREIKEKHPEVDYRFQFGICLSFLYNKKEEEEVAITIKEINAVAEKYGLEAAYWEKYGYKRIYINYYTGAGYRKTHGFFTVKTDGTITRSRKDSITGDALSIFEEIKNEKFMKEVI